MPRVSAAFFATGVLCILASGAIGMYMAHANDATYGGLHAHLNLVGWATMALCGTFYALTRGTMWVPLAWINYAILTAGIVLFFPAYALFLSHGNDPVYEPVMTAGNGLTGLGMLVFAISVFRELFRARPSN
ncbi:MAG TPA: hypothetical protein VNU97_13270 [Rhizomicrobium sp.]|jgi:hypothetical protein|nr:hypothetical protein [Rhizomicrobium sp.]